MARRIARSECQEKETHVGRSESSGHLASAHRCLCLTRSRDRRGVREPVRAVIDDTPPRSGMTLTPDSVVHASAGDRLRDTHLAEGSRTHDHEIDNQVGAPTAEGASA